MNLRTTFPIAPSDRKIDYFTPAMFIGSCFASATGSKMEEGRMKVMINPAGTVYNPSSVGSTLDFIIENKHFTAGDIYNYKGTNLSFSHYTNFSSDTPEEVLEKINASTRQAHSFLKKASCLFITFGTARVFRFNETGEIVSNCHKLPASLFTRELLTVEEIAGTWNDILLKLRSFNKSLQVIFTVSPVRHWKDGAHGNQVSKSVLILAIEKLLDHMPSAGYFPAYEILMDDLRDYRFYDRDMLHPSETAIDYIWDAFTDCYFEKETKLVWKEVMNVTKAMNHRFLSSSAKGKKEFALNVLRQISALEKKNVPVDFSQEISYFQDIIKI
jgi:hypothetical protein